MNKRIWPGAILIAFAVSLVLAEGFNVPKGPCGSAPPSKPQRRKGGEGFGPLPLPVTPLRRTEKKRPPAPPPLVAKIQYGSLKEFVRQGKPVRYHDWNKDPGDVPMLMNIANRTLGMNFTHKVVALSAVGADPAQYPIYYFTGSDAFSLNERELGQLREFVLRGGTIWGDTCFGDPDFFKAFVKEMSKAFPGSHFRRLEADHPLFHCFYEVERVAYTRKVPDAPDGEPVFYGLDIGCRTAVILSRYDLSCGWDGHIREGAMSVHPNDARKLGVNMICHALAMHQLGVYQSEAKIYFEKDERARGDFVFAQAKLTDNWDTQTNAVANLLKHLASSTSTEVRFERRAVKVSSDDLQKYPFLYLSGHHEFTLTQNEVKALQRFLASGGTILASPCCGRREFDGAFRREIARVVGGKKLEPIPAGHPIYHVLHEIEAVHYNSYVESLGEAPPELPLEGISVGGAVQIVYCPYGLGGGWRGFDHPFARDVAHADALKLGVNALVYFMTH